MKFAPAFGLVGIIHCDHHTDREVSVGHMADYGRYQFHLRDIALSFCHAFSEPRYRYAYVGCKALAAGAKRKHGPIRIVPGLPKSRSIFGFGLPFEGAAAKLSGNFAETLRLFGNTRLRAVKFEKKRRAFFQSEL